jgi:hypothetical protein
MAIDQRRAIVRVATLIATEPFQSAELTRFYLGGTCVLPQDNGVILSATDGHTLVAIRQLDGYASGLPTVWNCQAKKRLGQLLATFRTPKKTLGRQPPGIAKDLDLWADLQYGNPGGPTLTVKVAASAGDILAGGGETKLMVVDRALFVDGTYPDFQRLFRTHPTQATEKPQWGGPFAIQSVYLSRAAALAKALGSANQPSVCFGAIAGDKAVLVTIPGMPEVICLLMPIAIGEQDLPVVPRWITDPAEPQAPDATVQEPVTRLVGVCQANPNEAVERAA